MCFLDPTLKSNTVQYSTYDGQENDNARKDEKIRIDNDNDDVAARRRARRNKVRRFVGSVSNITASQTSDTRGCVGEW